MPASRSRPRSGDGGGQATALAAHIGEPEAIDALFAALDARGLAPDILVNNAATNPHFGPMCEQSLASFQKTIDVNLRGYFWTTVQAAQRMLRGGGGGAIVNIASVNARRSAPGQGVYSMTKAGIVSLTENFAKELGSQGVRVNAVLPGLTDTKFAGALTSNDKILKMMLQLIPLGRVAQPDGDRADGRLPVHAGRELRHRREFHGRRRLPRVERIRLEHIPSVANDNTTQRHDMIDLHYWPTPNGHKITLFLEELAEQGHALEYVIKPVNINAGEQFKPEYLAVSPNNKMPAIVDHAPAGGGAPVSVFESGAILLYLAEKTGQLLPSDLRGRVETLEWLFWQMGGFGPMTGQHGHFSVYAPEKIAYADRSLHARSRAPARRARQAPGRPRVHRRRRLHDRGLRFLSVDQSVQGRSDRPHALSADPALACR